MLQNVVREEMNKALKAGDKQRKVVLSLLVSALYNKTKDIIASRPTDNTEIVFLTTEQENEVVLKMVKQIKETLASCPEDRTAIINQCNFELSVLNEFMPKQMTVPELTTVIDTVLTNLNIRDSVTKQHKGLIMKNLMPLVKGKIDGQIVNKTLESYFSE